MRIRKTNKAAALCRIAVGRSNTTTSTGTTTRHRKCRCAGHRQRYSIIVSCIVNFDSEGVTGGRYPPLYFRPWLVVTPKLFIP
jgi:hypothetical protein